MEKWSEELRKNPENLNEILAKKIDDLKRDMAPFYFNYEPTDLQYGPVSWFEDVTWAYKNILVGIDMQEARSLLTGRSTSLEYLTYWDGVETSAISVTRDINKPGLWAQKYINFERAMHYLNTSSCLNMATCHQIRMKVIMENLMDKNSYMRF